MLGARARLEEVSKKVGGGPVRCHKYYMPKPYGWGRVRLPPGAKSVAAPRGKRLRSLPLGAREKGCPRGQDTTEVAPTAKDGSCL